ncbi:MAG: hypothetical protein C5B51_03885, partial [Terriglobia bacterium]
MLSAFVLFSGAVRPAAAQNISGYLDYSGCGFIYGWAWDSNHPNLPVSVTLTYDGGTFLTTQVANLYRADLQAAGIGNGNHGFWFSSIPANLKNGQVHTIEAKVNNQSLTLSPRLLECPLESSGYSYYVTSNFISGIDATKWSSSGNLTTTQGVLASTTSGTLLSTAATPTGSQYQVDATLSIKGNGGTYSIYLGATSQSLAGTGSYYAVRLINPTISGSACTATLETDQVTNGAYTVLSSVTLPCFDGQLLRVSYLDGYIEVLSGGWSTHSLWQEESYITLINGAPAVGVSGMPSGSGMSLVSLGPHDSIAPGSIDHGSVRSLVTGRRISLSWPGVVDDPNGIGWLVYNIYRDGQFFRWTREPEFEDLSVNPSETHTYTIQPIDVHLNATSINLTFTTPPVDGIDPRRIGVRPTGSYWGAAGEQIDVQSGNLNFSVPLLKTQSRGGWGATFALSYNSQVWRKDPNGAWKLGTDVGYGFGWRLLAGSITPVWADYTTLACYLYTDAAGAEYRLNVNTNGVWTSHEGIYISYDSASNRLYFPDGSFWLMNAQSDGSEADAGTLYPTIMQDSNGNYTQIAYAKGVNTAFPNSSARITQIDDSRRMAAYQFTYQADAIPHLTSITNGVGTAESYQFAYYPTQTITDPFNAAGFGTVTLLQRLTVSGLNISHSFEYTPGTPNTTTTGELSHMTTPLGGQLWWQYRTFLYSGGIGYRELQYRQMTPGSGGPAYQWSLVNENGAQPAIHQWMQVVDQGTNTSKIWSFAGSGTYMGLTTLYEERNGQNVDLLSKAFTWTQNSAANVYIGSVITTLDPTTANAQTKTAQTLDIYGNLTQSTVYDYGNLNTPARTYNFSYLADTNYTSRFIRNRLTQATVTPYGGSALTLASNNYDEGTLTLRTGTLLHDDANYTDSFHYRGNATTVNNFGDTRTFTYETTGVANQTTDGGGTTVGVTPSASTNYSLPGVLTPNGNASLQTNVSYNTSNWEVTSTAGPNGATAQTDYDSYGRPTRSQTADQSADTQNNPATVYSYTYNPNTQTATLGNRWKKTTMDGFGRLSSVSVGHDNVTESTVDTQYAPCACSPLGKMWRVSQPYAPGGTVYWTTYGYDARGRTIWTKAPDNASTTWNTYWGNLTQSTDAAGKWKNSLTDVFGNLTLVQEPDPQNPNNNTWYTFYTYNGANQLTQVTIPRTNGTQTRTFVWSGIDLVSTTNPENGTVAYTYTSGHRVASRTDAKGQRTEYSYDSYGRQTQVRHYAWKTINGYQYLLEDTNQQWNLYYDTNPIESNYSANASGRLTAVTFGNTFFNFNPSQIAYEYSYNQAGRVTNQRLRATVNTSNFNLDAAYGWDNEGRMTSQTYPSIPNGVSPVYAYGFDTMGRLSGMSENGNGIASAAFNYAGQITSMTMDSFTETRTYDPAMLQLTHLTTRQSPSNTTVVDMAYAYTAGQNNGRISQSTDGVLGET